LPTGNIRLAGLQIAAERTLEAMLRQTTKSCRANRGLSPITFRVIVGGYLVAIRINVVQHPILIAHEKDNYCDKPERPEPVIFHLV
jgi:hypothetical protein